MLRGRYPGIALDDDRSHGLGRRDQDAVEADVKHAYPMRQAAYIERYPALETAALDPHEKPHCAAWFDGHFRLVCGRGEIAGCCDGGLGSHRLAHYFLAVNAGAGDQLERSGARLGGGFGGEGE